MTTFASPLTPAPLPACTRLVQVFQDPRLEEPGRHGADQADRSAYAGLVATAGAACRSCPLVTACLYRAVVEHDVAGYVAGTTARQRSEIRRRLGVTVRPEDFDTLAGVVGGGRQIDHDEVLRLRNAHPDESLETLAGRLGCSLSTVKRHLRRERNAPSEVTVSTSRPRLHQVLVVAAEVTAAGRSRAQAA
ncbi:WhiB family transcriptional regulator [uncultured Friedmanniella sp.]|uniref:WhiB family transcriptional regulator n=1 Tax=uncultured Friedmanniella sp. TaxID=335381 RepID=UPI0035C9BBE2